MFFWEFRIVFEFRIEFRIGSMQPGVAVGLACVADQINMSHLNKQIL